MFDNTMKTAAHDFIPQHSLYVLLSQAQLFTGSMSVVWEC